MPCRPLALLALLATMPAAAAPTPAAAPRSPDAALAEEAVKAIDPGDSDKLSFLRIAEWNGHVLALVETREKGADGEPGNAGSVELVALKRKGAKLVKVGSVPACTTAYGPDAEGESSDCSLDVTTWGVTDAVPAIAVVEKKKSDAAGRDSSSSSTDLRLFWIDAGGLRTIFELTLERQETHSISLYTDITEKLKLQIQKTRAFGFHDLLVTGTRESRPSDSETQPRGERAEGTTEEISTPYTFDGTLYEEPVEGRHATLTASSQLVEKGLKPDFYAPGKMQDGRLNTAWAEGVKGPGIGEKITFTYSTAFTPRELRLYGACSDRPKLFRENHRIRKVELALSNGFKQVFELKDLARVNRFALAKAPATTTATLTILEVFKGSKYDDTCIAEASLR